MKVFASTVVASLLLTGGSLSFATTPTVRDGTATTEASSGFNPDTFANPRPDSLPAIYWYWDGNITDEIITMEMREMREKGIHEFVLFPFNSDQMRPVFGSEAWFDRVEHTLKEASEHDMKVWLFNDNNFPSGRGATLVTDGGQLGDRTFEPQPEHRLKGLWRSTAVLEGGQQIQLDRSSGVSAEDGRLAVDGQVLDGAAPLSVGADWTDYTVEGTDVRLSGQSGGLMVRASADGQSGYLIEIDGKGVLTVTRLDDGDRTLLATGESVPGFTFQRPRVISVEVNGDEITPYLDGKPQESAIDSTYETGTVALFNEEQNRTLWGDLQVSTAESVLWESDFEDDTAFADFVATLELEQEAVAAVARPASSSDSSEMIELTPELDGEGRPTWQAPAGTWQVDLFGSMPLKSDASTYTRGYLDLLSEDATDAFMNTIPQEYVDRFGWAMGTVVPGFWDDEPFIASAQPHPWKRHPWSPTLAAEIEELGGTPGKVYASAYEAPDRGGEILNGIYWEAVSNRFAEAYYKRQATWMADHGLQLITNPLLDELNPSSRLSDTGDLTKNNQWAHVPGTDAIQDDYVPGEQSSLGRNAASAAHQNGSERVVMESFGNSGWQIAPDRMHATVGALAARGSNQFFLHAMWTNEERVIYPPPFGPRSTFWEEMLPMSEWIGRVSEIARGSDQAQTALVQPQQSAQQLHGSSSQTDVDAAFEQAGFALERSQVDFDLLTDGALSGDPAVRNHAEVEDGRLIVGEASYGFAVLPETPVLDLATVTTLSEFVRTGGHLVVIGDLPSREASGNDEALGEALAELGIGDYGSAPLGTGVAVRVATLDEAGEAVANLGGAAVIAAPEATSLRVARKAQGEDLAFLIHNESAESVDTELTFPVTGTAEFWDLTDGSIDRALTYTAQDDSTTIPVEMDPYETIAVVFQDGAEGGPHLTSSALPATAVSADGAGMTAELLAEEAGDYPVVGHYEGRTFLGMAEVSDPLDPIVLDGTWRFRFDSEDAQEQEVELGSWTDLDPTFSGTGVYTKQVDFDEADLTSRRWLLDLGAVRDLAAVSVNGEDLPTALWHPYVVDVTSTLQAGVNSIEIRVSNTLANERGKDLPSGLLGPVTLVPQAEVSVQLFPTDAELMSTGTSLESSQNPAIAGEAVSFRAQVTADDDAAEPVNTGAIQFLVNGIELGEPEPVVDGVATSPTVSDLELGRHTVTAKFSGDGYLPSQASLQQEIGTAGETTSPAPSDGDDSADDQDAAGTGDSDLPSTGARLQLPVFVAILLLSLGGAAAWLSRRRSSIG